MEQKLKDALLKAKSLLSPDIDSDEPATTHAELIEDFKELANEALAYLTNNPGIDPEVEMIIKFKVDDKMVVFKLSDD